MGCDIHSIAEIRVNGVWEAVGDEFISGYGQTKTSEPFDSRNYSTFALLADVRNNHGIKPIDTPRGVPEECSYEYKKMVEELEGDGHSHSYFTLKELFDVDWNQIVKFTSYIPVEDYEIFKLTHRPPTYSFFGDGSNPNHKEVTWYETLSEACQSFRYEAMPQMRMVAQKYKLEDNQIRILFFFDN